MKISKEQLKNIIRPIVRELVQEMMLEAFGSSNVQPPMQFAEGERKPQRVIAGVQRQNARRFDPHLDTPIQQRNNALSEIVKKEAGGNPVLADILADTAQRTLPSFISNDTSTPMLEQKEQFNGSVEDVFGDAASLRPDGSSHWADLAFSSPTKKLA